LKDPSQIENLSENPESDDNDTDDVADPEKGSNGVL
jgi:hypothetical protein